MAGVILHCFAATGAQRWSGLVFEAFLGASRFHYNHTNPLPSTGLSCTSLKHF